MICPRTAGAILTALLLASQVDGNQAFEKEVRLRIVGSNPASTSHAPFNVPYESYYFRPEVSETYELKRKHKPIAWYSDIYPGIDLVSYGDEYQLEYVFAVSPGADPSLIKMAFEQPEHMNLNRTGSIVLQMEGGEMVQARPVVFFIRGDKKRRIMGRYDIAFDKTISFWLGEEFYNRYAGMNGTRMNLVPAGGQPGGPMYDFYVAKFEVTNEQFLRFLNDAEANRDVKRGANMYFRESGSVAFREDNTRRKAELFSGVSSRLTYNPGKPKGGRYDHVRAPDGGAPYASHPVSGVSWYGAVKYCNWMTLEAGRGSAQLCYGEGDDPVDWAPVTATNWAEGTFGPTEREQWLSYRGFRLPMVDSQPPSITTNAYNEYYKAAAWSATTNRLYGFGRDTCDITDANCRDLSVTMGIRTLPVGFFNGKNRLGNAITKPNNNFYGIHDLTGNVSEWMTDRGREDNLRGRAVCGGSWAQNEESVMLARVAAPASTGPFCGFRPSTTYLPSEALMIHVLFSFYADPPVPPKDLPKDITTAIQIGKDDDEDLEDLDETDDAGMRKQTGPDVDSDTGLPDAILYNQAAEPEEPEEEGPPLGGGGVYVPIPLPDPDASPGGI